MAHKQKHGASYTGRGKSPVSERKSGWGKFAATATLSTVLAGGALTYVFTQGNPSPRPTAVTSPADSPYLSLDEAAAMYLRLEGQVKQQWEEARRQNRPFHIVVLEGHDSVNALACELMLVDIASRLGIKTLATELDEAGQRELLSGPFDPHNIPRARAQVLLKNALKKNMTLLAAEGRYPTIAEENEAIDALQEKLASPKLKEYLGAPGIVVNATADPRPDSDEFTYRLEGLPAPLGETQKEGVHAIMQEARHRAFHAVRDERSAYTAALLKKTGSALMIGGKNHGIGLVSPLREDGAALAFSVSMNKEKIADAAQLASAIPEYEKDLMRWTNNPKNAIQCEGKDFNPENLPIFVERAIERAQQKGARDR